MQVIKATSDNKDDLYNTLVILFQTACNSTLWELSSSCTDTTNGYIMTEFTSKGGNCIIKAISHKDICGADDHHFYQLTTGVNDDK